MKQHLSTHGRAGRHLLLVIIFLGSIIPSYAQQTVSGKVTSMITDEGLPGVNILVKGTGQGTVTDVNGDYQLQEVSGTDTLVFSSIGFTAEEVVVGDQTTIDMSLADDIEQLSEVVVVGYGTVKKSDLTGAVAKIEGDALQKIATSDPTSALQGRVSGVQVTSNSGAPGAGNTVRIRGVGTINNANPLYVVDGYPTGDISYIPPNDIESVEVLKDASAAAIYGSRGANGVIMVTTKSGKAGETRVELNSFYGVKQAWNQLDLLNANEYATLRNESFANAGQEQDAISAAQTEFVLANQSEGTDWQEEIFRPAITQNYSVSVRGGTEDLKYNVSSSYFGDEGIVENTFLHKVFVRSGLDFKISDRVSAGVNASFTQADFTNFNSSPYFGPLTTALRKDPITSAQVTGNEYDRSNLTDVSNPRRITDEGANRLNDQFRFLGGGDVQITLTDQLSFTSRFTYDRKDQIRTVFEPVFTTNGSEFRTESVLTEQTVEQTNWVSSSFLNYNNDLGAHSINAVLGTETYYNEAGQILLRGTSIPEDESIRYFINSASPESFSVQQQGGSRNTIQSFFARGTYSYDNRYLLTATARYDGASKFIGDNKWGFFPSFSAGWNIHSESFFTIDLVSQLKLRAGWGTVGNEGSVAPYSYLTTVQSGYNYTFGGIIAPGAISSTLANPDIRWETTESSNVGVDLGMFDDQLTFTADVFSKKTVDFIYNQPVPGFAGALGGPANIGNLRNRGIELALGYRSSFGALRYDIGVNATYLENEVLSLGDGEPFDQSFETKAGSLMTRLEAGHPIGYFYGLQADGVFNTEEELNGYVNGEGTPIQPNAQLGDVKYIDQNGDGAIDPATDAVELGSPIAPWTFGFVTTLRYKNFDLNVQLQAVYGNEIANIMTYYLENSDGGLSNNSLASRLDRWTPDNAGSSEPRVSAVDQNNNNLFSSRYIEDGSYLRLRNLQLGYTLPRDLLDAIRVRQLRVYVSSDNLLTFTQYTGLDPEIGYFQGDALGGGVDFGTYPQARTIIAGINLTF